MKLQFFGQKSDKCLLVVGGYGDTVQVFTPLLKQFSQQVNDYQVCSFDFTFASSVDNILAIQTKELVETIDELTTHHHYETIDIFCTSMGAYSTTQLLAQPALTSKIHRVIYFDPADYYLSATSDETWSGVDIYQPIQPVVSDLLKNIHGNIVVDVIHLTLRNYGHTGYFDSNYADRGQDHESGSPRLNTQMVKAFWHKLPSQVRGRYLELKGIPHGFIRDGDVSGNLQKIALFVNSILH